MTDHLPTITLIYAPWMDHAACADADAELFYATTETSIQNAARITQAKTYCDLCPVRAQCLLFALDHDDQWGIYGGTTVEERNKLRKKVAP